MHDGVKLALTHRNYSKAEALEPFPPDLGHCDEGILCRGEERGEERSLSCGRAVPGPGGPSRRGRLVRLRRQRRHGAKAPVPSGRLNARRPGRRGPQSDAFASVKGRNEPDGRVEATQ
jgi:hypothetical protein